MALSNILSREVIGLHEDTAQAVQDKVVEILQDPVIRREVFEEAFEELDDISMMEIHVVLDALVSAIRGEADE